MINSLQLCYAGIYFCFNKCEDDSVLFQRTLMFHDLVTAVNTPARDISSVVLGPSANASSLQRSLASTYTIKKLL